MVNPTTNQAKDHLTMKEGKDRNPIKLSIQMMYLVMLMSKMILSLMTIEK